MVRLWHSLQARADKQRRREVNGLSKMGVEEAPTFWMPTALKDGQGSDLQIPFGAYPPHGNYWHYLIGYLAPVCRALEEQRGLVGLETKVIVNLQSSSNEIMDGIAKEILESSQIELNFLAVETHRTSWLLLGSNSSLLSMLKRFNKWCFRRFPRFHLLFLVPLWRGAPFRALHIDIPLVKKLIQRWIWKWYPLVPPINATSTEVMIPIPSKDSLEWWFNADLPCDPDYQRDIRALKNAVSRRRSESCSSEYQKKVLIIRRPLTATQTRVIGDDEMLKEKLVDVGIPAVIYEPGQHSFRCQVRVFQDARGVVGLRGAEFANLLWCEGPIPIILIQQKAIHENDPPQSKLCDLLDLTISVINRSTQNVSIDVDVKVGEIVPLLAQYELEHQHSCSREESN